MLTLATVRQNVAKLITEPFVAETADGSGCTSTLIRSAALKAYPSGRFNGQWVLMTAGGDDGAQRMIDTSVVTNGDLNIVNALGSAPDGDTFEIYPVKPDSIKESIVLAGRQLFGRLQREVVYKDIVAGSPLYNAGFEEEWASGNPTGWAASAVTVAPAVTAPYYLPAFGSRSAKLSTAAGYLGVSAEYRVDLLNLRGQHPHLYFWVWCDTASAARIALYDGTTITYSDDHHDGDSQWQLLDVDVAIGEDATDVDVRLYLDNNAATAYFDGGWIENGGIVKRMRCPALFPNGPTHIRGYTMSDREDTSPETDLLYFTGWDIERHEYQNAATIRQNIVWPGRAPPSAYRLVMTGRAPLTEVSADTDVVEVTTEQSTLLEARAARLLLGRHANAFRHIDVEKALINLGRMEREVMARVAPRVGAGPLA